MIVFPKVHALFAFNICLHNEPTLYDISTRPKFTVLQITSRKRYQYCPSTQKNLHDEWLLYSQVTLLTLLYCILSSKYI